MEPFMTPAVLALFLTCGDGDICEVRNGCLIEKRNEAGVLRVDQCTTVITPADETVIIKDGRVVRIDRDEKNGATVRVSIVKGE